jgi:general secretion pathway protein K
LHSNNPYRAANKVANRQSGVALITVLFIFALVSMLAVSIQTQQEQSFRQVTSTLKNTQDFITLLSVEDIAKAGLMFDSKRDKDSNELWDTASELWNQPFPITMGPTNVAIYIRDLQGLFNLNSLHPNHPQSNLAKARFERLLSNLTINTDIAQNLREWFTAGSSFNFQYQNLSPGYSSPEIEFIHVSELMLVEGMNADDFKTLEPYIAALPMATPLNINTSYPEILTAWDVKLSEEDSELLINKTRSLKCGNERNDFVFKDVDALFNDPIIKPLASAQESNWDKGDFDVKTKYFSVISIVKTDDKEMVLESIIKRDDSTDFVGTVYRDFSRQPDDINRLVKSMNCVGV